MSYKGPGRKLHQSNRGVTLDMEAMRAAAEGTVAVTGSGSGARMNARGDVLGVGGKIERTREQIEQEYNRNPEGNVKNVSLKQMQADVFETPQEVLERLKRAADAADQRAATPAVDVPDNVVNRRQARKLVDKND